MVKKIYRGMSYLDVEDLIKRSKIRPRKPSIDRAINMLSILKRDNFKCVQCGSDSYLTIDHIKPMRYLKRKKNGRQYSKNFKCQTLCVDCHIEKNLFNKYDEKHKELLG